MLFNSVDFLLFFPVVTILFFAIPKRVRNVFLLACSLYFYMCWKAKYILLIAFSILVTYLSALVMEWLEKQGRQRLRGLILAGAIVSSLAVLFLFKYYNFFVENVAALTQNRLLLPLFNFALPVGISFYTFQALSYAIDVYRHDIPAEKNLITYALFVSFYPQLVAGPIERSTNLMPQIKAGTRFDFENMRAGLLLMGWGMFQKLVIADRLALFVDEIYNNYAGMDGSFLILATVLFALQIYCDFGSYSNIARGAAAVMGYRLMINFNAPYFSRTFAEYWSRWHISLSTWFQDYIFEPVVWKMRNKAAAAYVGVLIVFFISGFWHGASWTYVIWGCLHALFRVLEMALRRPKKKLYKKLGINAKSRWLQVLETVWVFLCVCFTFIFFRSESLEQAFGVVGRIATQTHFSALFSGEFFSLGLDEKDFTVALIALIVLVVADWLVYHKKDIYHWVVAKPLAARWALYWLLIFSSVIFGVYGPSYDAAPFIYFQF